MSVRQLCGADGVLGGEIVYCMTEGRTLLERTEGKEIVCCGLSAGMDILASRRQIVSTGTFSRFSVQLELFGRENHKIWVFLPFWHCVQ